MWSKCAGIKQKDAKEMPVRHTQAPVPAANGFRLQESSVLNSSPSDCVKSILSVMCQIKGQEKHKGKILNPLRSGSCLQPLWSTIQAHLYSLLQITWVLGDRAPWGQLTQPVGMQKPCSGKWLWAARVKWKIPILDLVSFKRNQHKPHHCSAIQNKVHSDCKAETA